MSSYVHMIIRLCRRIPMLLLTIAGAVPMVLCRRVRPWGVRQWTYNPTIGELVVVVLVLVSVVASLREMIEDLRHGHVGVDVLAVVAMLSTLAVRQYWAAWAVVLMVWSGDAIEGFAQSRAEGNLTALMAAAPQVAHVNGSDVPVENVRLGDVLNVLPGETVPVDGTMLSDVATLDMSNINGEPVPRQVGRGCEVFSGSVNGSKAFLLRATSLAQDSQYQRILELVGSARESRAPVIKTADMLAVPFTVLSFVIAGLAWLISASPLRFAQVLVLATPCPLLIAAPVAFMAGTSRLAKSGILIKSQDILENLGRVTHVFFDKTGTVTGKRPQVIRVDMADGAEEAEVLRRWCRPDSGCNETPASGVRSNRIRVLKSDSRSGQDVAGERSVCDEHGMRSSDLVLAVAGALESNSVHVLAQGIAKAGGEAAARLYSLSSKSGRGASSTGKSTGASGEVRAASSQSGRSSSTDKSWGRPLDMRSLDAGDVQENSGEGVSGTVMGVRVRVGRLRYVMAGEERFDGNEDVGVLQEPEASCDGLVRLSPVARDSALVPGRQEVSNPDGASGRAWSPRQDEEVRFSELRPDEMAAFVSFDGKLVARIVLRDEPRRDAKDALSELRRLSITKLSMLTGDHWDSAYAIAKEVGIEDVHAQMLPKDKLDVVRAAQHESVEAARWRSVFERIVTGRSSVRPVTMMVGDGVNDAPVLAAANIGVAMTDGASTAASQSAQVVIMNDDIMMVPYAVLVARQTKRVMLQAVLGGLALAVVGMVAASFDLIPAVVGAFAQEGIDVVSILWALSATLDRRE